MAIAGPSLLRPAETLKAVPLTAPYTIEPDRTAALEAAPLSVRLLKTTEEMANRCSVPMDLWDRHSNACLEAASTILSTVKEADRMREAVQGLFAGGFIDAGTRENDQWSQELEARLKPLRAALLPSEGTKP